MKPKSGWPLGRAVRARRARTKDEQLQAAMAEAEQAFRQAWADQAPGRSARLAAA